MSKVIKADDLQKELSKYLEDYAEDIEEDVKTETKEITKEAVQELKQNSPARKSRQICGRMDKTNGKAKQR